VARAPSPAAFDLDLDLDLGLGLDLGLDPFHFQLPQLLTMVALACGF